MCVCVCFPVTFSVFVLVRVKNSLCVFSTNEPVCVFNTRKIHINNVKMFHHQGDTDSNINDNNVPYVTAARKLGW